MNFLNLKEAGEIAKKDYKQAIKELEKYDVAISKNQESTKEIQEEIQNLVDQINGKRARIQGINTATSDLMVAKLKVQALAQHYAAEAGVEIE